MKVFKTSDNNIYNITDDTDISPIVKHCLDNNIKLFEVVDGEEKEVELKSKKKKENGTA